MTWIVDTNVAAVAQGLHQSADQSCVDACIDKLLEVVESGGLVVDDLGEIVEEYTSVLSHAGKPGIGRQFAKWAWDHRGDDIKVKQVAIQRTEEHGWKRYLQIPNITDLKTLDPKDQKFVAVAVSCTDSPPIVFAIERGWWKHKTALESAGIRLDGLCPRHNNRIK